MISSNVAIQLNLPVLGKVQVQGIGPHVTHHNAYLFHVAFVIPIISPGQVIAPGSTVQAVAHVLPNPILGGEITASGYFDVLLGMDVIAAGSLKVEGNGQI
jgi:hypothetical protein